MAISPALGATSRSSLATLAFEPRHRHWSVKLQKGYPHGYPFCKWCRWCTFHLSIMYCPVFGATPPDTTPIYALAEIAILWRFRLRSERLRAPLLTRSPSSPAIVTGRSNYKRGTHVGTPFVNGAGGGTRTHTPARTTDFESASSANSDTPAFPKSIIQQSSG